MKMPRRYTPSSTSVYPRRALSSATRKTLVMAFSATNHSELWETTALVNRLLRLRHCRNALSRVRLRRGFRLVRHQGDLFRRAAGLRDGFFRRRAEAVRLHGQLLRELARAEHLDARP